MQPCAYEFGPYRQDPATRTLTRNGAPVEIPPKNFDTLLYLVSNAGRTVGRDEVMRAVWPDTFVEEGNLNYNISRIRSVLGDYEHGVPYIQTIPKQGTALWPTSDALPRNNPRSRIRKSLAGQAGSACQFPWLSS